MKIRSRPAPGAHRRAIQITSLAEEFGPLEFRSPDQLRVFPGNPRNHPDKQIVKLTASILEFGFTLPVLVAESGEIIAGEARIEAARRLGLLEVPVVVARGWSQAKLRAYRLADNRLAELATWDEDLLAIEIRAVLEFDETPIEILGWETAEIDLVIAKPIGAAAIDPVDQVPEPPKVAASREGDLWIMGGHRLFCASSLEASNWATLMGDETAAMAFSDPPYNVPIGGHVCGLGSVQHAEFVMASGEMTSAQFTDFLGSSIQQMSAQLKNGGVLTLAMDWRHSAEMLAAIAKNQLSLLNLCVWNKRNGGMGSLYRSKHELFWIARKGLASHTNNVELGKHGRYRTNVWDYAGVNSFGKNRMTDLADHPTVKPIALVADAIRDVSHPGEIVIDGFMGSGTTILAAERTRRRCFGIELAPPFVDVAIRRWETMTGQRAVLAETGETFAEVAERRRDGSSGNPEWSAGDEETAEE